PLRAADRGHVPRADRGRRTGGGGRAEPAAPVYEGAALGRAAARPARPAEATDPAGRNTRCGVHSDGLPLPSPVPGRDRSVLGGGSGARAAGVGRGGTPSRLPVAAYGAV